MIIFILVLQYDSTNQFSVWYRFGLFRFWFRFSISIFVFSDYGFSLEHLISTIVIEISIQIWILTWFRDPPGTSLFIESRAIVWKWPVKQREQDMFAFRLKNQNDAPAMSFRNQNPVSIVKPVDTHYLRENGFGKRNKFEFRLTCGTRADGFGGGDWAVVDSRVSRRCPRSYA